MPGASSVALCILIAAGSLLHASDALEQLTSQPLSSWSFVDTSNWMSDFGRMPVSFTNLNCGAFEGSSSLEVDSTNPAWLEYPVVEEDGTTNLTVNTGSVTFWFTPNWRSASAGGDGPREPGRFIEAGAFTPDSSYGWWSIYCDGSGNNVYFSAQTNDFSSNVTTYVSAPISNTYGMYHFIALTYSATNTALYLDGVLANMGPPMTVYPGPNALTNGFFVGSDRTGTLQARGLYNYLETYNIPLDPATIQNFYDLESALFMPRPLTTLAH